MEMGHTDYGLARTARLLLVGATTVACALSSPATLTPSVTPTPTPTALPSPNATTTSSPTATPTGGPTAATTPSRSPAPSLAPSPTPAATPSAPINTGRIAFDLDGDIYTMGADGSNVTRLTSSAAYDEAPVWSPDGTRIAFLSNAGRRTSPNAVDIYVMDADGSNVTRVTHNDAYDFRQVWSPDGTRIAFMSRRGPEGIYVIDADGSNEMRLTGDDNVGDFAWSPDGSRIAFTSDRDDPDPALSPYTSEIYVMDADGSDVVQLTSYGETTNCPAWAPDGSRIAYQVYRVGGGVSYHIYSMDADGSDAVRLTRKSFYGACPIWSPDGSRIVFGAMGDYAGDIFVMDANGSTVRRLTNNNDPHDPGADASNPVWSPDGRRIAFVSANSDPFAASDPEIYVMDADGSNAALLHAGWSPDWCCTAGAP